MWRASKMASLLRRAVLRLSSLNSSALPFSLVLRLWAMVSSVPLEKLQLQCCSNKPVVSIVELSIPVDPAVVDHPPSTINEHMINLLCHTTSVGIPSPAMSLWALKP